MIQDYQELAFSTSKLERVFPFVLIVRTISSVSSHGFVQRRLTVSQANSAYDISKDRGYKQSYEKEQVVHPDSCLVC